tara:strand:+ start:40 stop:435 length:396 start_codon:yes stop_codon:yes gene_type:complete
MGKFKLEKKIGNLIFQDDTDYFGLEVKVMLEVPLKLMINIQNLAESKDPNKILEANHLWCDAVLISWNLTDEEGNDVPATGAGAVAVAPVQLLAAIITKWTELTLEPSANLEKPQNDIPTLETLASLSQSN